ncbi:MAG: hypothetical protein FD123_3180 [Bacteroidetes bacterium]|nr:MAG: hypothetical protein FD123_3180 [Bacteroidota bacterium]
MTFFILFGLVYPQIFCLSAPYASREIEEVSSLHGFISITGETSFTETAAVDARSEETLQRTIASGNLAGLFYFFPLVLIGNSDDEYY